MKTPLSLVFSAVVLASAYTYTFGVPALPGGAAADAAAAGDGTVLQQPAKPQSANKNAKGTVVTLQNASYQPYSDVLSAIGTGSALRSVDVKSEISGVVVKSNLNANHIVAAGDILVQLDNTNERISVDIAQAKKEQTLGLYNRYKKLGDSISDAVRDEARANYQMADAELRLAESQLAKRTITAPISGKLSLSRIEIGDLLTLGTDIVSIDDASSILVEFELPERSTAFLAPNKQIQVSTPTFPDKTFSGEIVAFDSRIDNVTRSITVKAKIDNQDNQLWTGMTFAVDVTQESAPALMIPSTAITWDKNGSSIWISKDSIASKQSVTILHRSGEQVWVSGDFDGSVQVVTEGTQKVRPGVQLTAMNIELDVNNPAILVAEYRNEP